MPKFEKGNTAGRGGKTGTGRRQQTQRDNVGDDSPVPIDADIGSDNNDGATDGIPVDAAAVEGQSDILTAIYGVNLPYMQVLLDLPRGHAFHPMRLKRSASGLPLSPHRMIATEQDFDLYLRQLTPENWQYIDLYIYQNYPALLQVDKGDKYLYKIIGQQPDDIEHYIDTFIAENGSGNYSFTFNDRGIGGRFRTVARATVNLTRPEHPPKFNIAQLDLNHKNNASLVVQLKREGKLTIQGDIVAALPTNTGDTAQDKTIDKLTDALLRMTQHGVEKQNSGQGNEVRMVDRIIDTMGKANDKAVESAVKSVQQSDPTAMLGVFAKLFEVMKPAPAPAPDNTMITILLDQSKAAREEAAAARAEAAKAQTQMFTMLTAAMQQKQEQASPIKMVQEVLQLRTALTGGIEAAAPLNWKEQGMQMLGEHAPMILNLAGNLLATRMQAPAESAQQQMIPRHQQQAAQAPAYLPSQQPQPVTIDHDAPRLHQVSDGDPTTQPQENDSPMQQSNAPIPAGPPVSGPVEVNGVPILGPDGRPTQRIMELLNLLSQYGSYFLTALIDQDSTGDEFAVSVVRFVGRGKYLQLKAYKPEEWTEASYMHAGVAPRLVGLNDKVTQFWLDFVECDGYQMEDDPDNTAGLEPEQATAPAAPVLVKPAAGKKGGK